MAILYQRADHLLAAEFGVRHSFGRRFIAMEFTISRPCGFYVHRQCCYRAEGFYTVLKTLLIITNGGRRNVPCYFVCDTACAFLYYMGNILTNHVDIEVPLASGHMVMCCAWSKGSTWWSTGFTSTATSTKGSSTSNTYARTSATRSERVLTSIAIYS